VSLDPIITSTCREFFGRNVETRSGRRIHVDNRCDACPLRAPCLAWGGKPAHTIEQLREAAEILGATP